MRAWIERLDPATYLASSYYARWLLAAEDGVVAKGVVTPDDLQRWHDRFAADRTPRRRWSSTTSSAGCVERVHDHPRPLAAGDARPGSPWATGSSCAAGATPSTTIAARATCAASPDSSRPCAATSRCPGREDDVAADVHGRVLVDRPVGSRRRSRRSPSYVDLCEEYLDAPGRGGRR